MTATEWLELAKESLKEYPDRAIKFINEAIELINEGKW